MGRHYCAMSQRMLHGRAVHETMAFMTFLVGGRLRTATLCALVVAVAMCGQTAQAAPAPLALRRPRRGRVPQRPAARPERAGEPGPARCLPGDRHATGPQRRPTRPVPGPALRVQGPQRRSAADLLQGRDLRRQARRRRAHLQPARRRDHRPRPQGRSAHLRLHPRRGALRHRLRDGRGPPVLPRRLPPRRAGAARVVRGRVSGEPCVRPPRLDRGAVHGGGPAAPDRRTAPRVRGRERDAARRPRPVRGRHQRLHLRGAAEPHEDARRVRGDQPAAGTGRLEGHRHGRHRARGRRDLRRRRRRRARVRADAAGGAGALRVQGGRARVARLPLGRQPLRPDDGHARDVPLPQASRAGPRPRAARPGLGARRPRAGRRHRDGGGPRAGRSRRAAVRDAGRPRPAGVPRRDVQRGPRLRPALGERPPAGGLRPADRRTSPPRP